MVDRAVVRSEGQERGACGLVDILDPAKTLEARVEALERALVDEQARTAALEAVRIAVGPTRARAPASSRDE